MSIGFLILIARKNLGVQIREQIGTENLYSFAHEHAAAARYRSPATFYQYLCSWARDRAYTVCTDFHPELPFTSRESERVADLLRVMGIAQDDKLTEMMERASPDFSYK